MLVLADLNLLLGLLQVDVGNGILAVEDGSDLLESSSLGLWEDEVNPDGLATIPNLIQISN